MSETTKKTTTKKTTAKKTTKSTAKKTTSAVATDNQAVTLTPELMAQFMALIQQGQLTLPTQEEPKTKPTHSQKPVTRADLNKRSEDVVDVYSTVGGTVIYESPKTKMQYQWTSVGECMPMAISELITMFSMKKVFLTKPWLRVDDEGFNEAFDLEKSVEAGKQLEQAHEVLMTDLTDIRNFVATLSDFGKEELANQTYALIKEERLTNIHIIRELEHLLGKDLMA